MFDQMATVTDDALSARVRFGPEKKLLDDMFASLGLEQLIQHEISSGNLVPLHRVVMARGLRLSHVTSPRLIGLLSEVAGAIGFTEPVDLYVYPESAVNACAFHRLEDDESHIVQVSSAAIQSMTDAELRFVLGHELGHLALRHYRVLVLQWTLRQQEEPGGDQRQGRRVPQVLERRLDRWSRLAEFSADRLGFAACGNDLQAAIAAFFRMASGLGPEHLRFDLAALLEQVEHLATLDRLEILAKFSHPATPVRARALQLYAQAGSDGAEAGALAAVDAQVDSLARLMDFEASDDLGRHARDFLLAAGVLAAHADGEASQQEQDVIMQLLLQVTGDPEGHLSRIKTRQEATDMLKASCDWLRENTGQERFSLFGQIVHITAIDGQLSKGEQKFIEELAGLLAIPTKAAREIVHEVLSHFVKASTASKGFTFGLGG
jgi:uncharacterized tellurite resistance protein B-like protein